MLKKRFAEPETTPKRMKEYLLRSIYCEMLGHDASFAYIHAVKLAASGRLLPKKIGYLTCNLCLHKDHELLLLLINSMQRDLNSSNHLEVCAALSSVCRLVNAEMIPAMLPLVEKVLGHAQPTVRKKAVMAMRHFLNIAPDTFNDDEIFRKILCDPDPCVMGASLHIFSQLAVSRPGSCKNLVPSFVSILKQIVEHRLPREYDYHRIPAPWTQIKLLNLLAVDTK